MIFAATITRNTGRAPRRCLFPNSPLRARRLGPVRRCTEPLGPRWASHRPDMPLAPGFHRYYGLGLYNSPLGLLIVEGGLWVIGIILYLRATHTRRFAAHLVLWTFIVVFTALWLLSLQWHATTKRARSRDGRSHPLSDRARLGILDRSFATAERDLRARITGNLDITPRGDLPTIRSRCMHNVVGANTVWYALAASRHCQEIFP
jgi:hypothetical protein